MKVIFVRFHYGIETIYNNNNINNNNNNNNNNDNFIEV